MKSSLFEWCADHITHFGAYPMEYAIFNDDGSEKQVFEYPDYLRYLDEDEKAILNDLLKKC